MATLKQEFIYFNDEYGRIRPNAKMKFFEAGTSTPKATYTGVDLVNPNPWPVVASGDGVFPPIFLEAGGYKVEVYDEDDELIRTRDDLNVAETTILSTSDFYFSTLVDAKLGVSVNGSPINLQVGQIARTAGKNTVDDGEGAEWIVVAGGTGTADDNLYADLDSNRQLKRLFNQLYSKNYLSEIAAAGASAQSDARDNIDTYSTTEIDDGFQAKNSAVLGFVQSTSTYCVEDDSYGTEFDVSASLTESSWESIGPTGSGSDNIWADLDILPSGTKWIRLIVRGRAFASGVTGTSGVTIRTSMHSRIPGSSAGTGTTSRVYEIGNETYADSSNVDAFADTEIVIPVVDGVFEIYWESNAFTTSPSIDIQLRGFGV